MDYCASGNQISNYSTSGGCCDPLVVKNIDCVTLEANNIDTNSLTVNGDLISDDITALENKTQFQSASSVTNTTTFTGTLSADSVKVNTGQVSTPALVTNTIQPMTTSVNFNSDLVVNGTMTTGSPFTVSDTATTGSSTTANFIQPNLTTGVATQILVGKDDSNNFNSAEIGFRRPTATAADNYAYFGLRGANDAGIRVYSTYVHFPTELRIGTTPSTGVIVAPRLNGVIQNASQMVGSNTSVNWTIPSANVKNTRRIVVMVNGMKKKANTGSPLLYSNGTPTYTGTTWGNQGASTQVWDATGIRIWNGPYPLTTTYTFNGAIEYSYLGVVNSRETWAISGNISCPQNTTPTSTDYYAIISGVVQMGLGETLTNLYMMLPAGDTSIVSDMAGTMNVLYY